MPAMRPRRHSRGRGRALALACSLPYRAELRLPPRLIGRKVARSGVRSVSLVPTSGLLECSSGSQSFCCYSAYPPAWPRRTSPVRWSKGAVRSLRGCALNVTRSEHEGRVPTPVLPPFARSIGDWSSILSSTGCAKGLWLVIRICRCFDLAVKTPAPSCYI